MNNKILKFNSGQYKGKAYQEITNNTEDLTNIININSSGYNKFKTWYKNIHQEGKKEESITRKRINNLIVDNDAYELRLINKKVVKEFGITNLAYSANINNNYNLRNLDFLGWLYYSTTNFL